MTDAPSASLLGFEYQALIDDITKKSIGFQTTISKDCSQEDLDALLDKCRIAVKRQRIFAEIEAKSIDLRNMEENIELGFKSVFEEDKRYAARSEGHDGRAARGLSASEQKARQDKITNLDNGRIMCESIRTKIEVLFSMVYPPPLTDKQCRPGPRNSNAEQGRLADNGGAAGGPEVGAFPGFAG
jgi:hypothetical protein